MTDRFVQIGQAFMFAAGSCVPPNVRYGKRYVRVSPPAFSHPDPDGAVLWFFDDQDGIEWVGASHLGIVPVDEPSDP